MKINKDLVKETGSLEVDGNLVVNGVVGIESGLSVDGQCAMPGGTRGKTISGGQGTQGYFYVCDITTTSNYQNQVIMFDVIQRGLSGTVKILLTSNSTPGNITVSSIRKQGDIEVYYIVTNNVLKIYLKKYEAYDQADICNIRKGVYMGNTTITWVNTTVESLPTGYSTALNDGKFAVQVTANDITSFTANEPKAFVFNGTTNLANTLSYWTINNGKLKINKSCTVLLSGIINNQNDGYMRLGIFKGDTEQLFYHYKPSSPWSNVMPISFALKVNYGEEISIKITRYNDNSSTGAVIRQFVVSEI